MCACAAHLKDDPTLVALWRNAADNEDAYWAYTKAFGPSRMFPKDDRLLGPLYKRYGQCSRLSHPSIYSLAMQTQIKKGETTTDVKVTYFQAEEDGINLFTTFMATIDTHRAIQAVFAAEVLVEHLANDPKRWAIRRDALEGQYLVQRERLRKRLEGRPKEEPPKGTPLIWLPD